MKGLNNSSFHSKRIGELLKSLAAWSLVNVMLGYKEAPASLIEPQTPVPVTET